MLGDARANVTLAQDLQSMPGQRSLYFADCLLIPADHEERVARPSCGHAIVALPAGTALEERATWTAMSAGGPFMLLPLVLFIFMAAGYGRTFEKQLVTSGRHAEDKCNFRPTHIMYLQPTNACVDDEAERHQACTHKDEHTC
jgi:hypothetical protein